MSYGILITNPEGKILIDGERRMPKLHHHGRYRIATREDYTATDWLYYHEVEFPPTNKPVFVSIAVDETEITPSTATLHRIRNMYIMRNPAGQFYKVRIEALYSYVYAFVWVYEI